MKNHLCIHTECTHLLFLIQMGVFLKDHGKMSLISDGKCPCCAASEACLSHVPHIVTTYSYSLSSSRLTKDHHNLWVPHFKEESGLRVECFADWCLFPYVSLSCIYISACWEPLQPRSCSWIIVRCINSCKFIVPLREWTDSDSCSSHVSFIAPFVDSCNWAWQLIWPCGGPMLLGGPACKNAVLWLEEAKLGWMSTVHRAGGMRDCTGTPPLAFSGDTVAMFVSPQPVYHSICCFTGYEKRVGCRKL